MSQAYQAKRVSSGASIDYTPSSNVAAGQVVVLNSLVGVPARPIAANQLGALDLEGVFEVVKVNGQINDGAALYWDADGNPQGGSAGTGALTTTSAGNTFFGFANGAAAANDETVRVRKVLVTSVANTIHNELSNVIADPGNAGAIPVTESGHCSIVTSGAQTRTLAAPSYAGQMLSLAMKTDGGDCVVTCATGVNQTGNNTITMNDAGDSILLVAIESGANLRWRVAYNDGCTLSTV
jgi:predicted RecA/RadA family phage recombinase